MKIHEALITFSRQWFRCSAFAWLISCVAPLLLASTVQAQLFSNGRPPRPQVTLPDDPVVRSIILESCSACHGIDEYGYYAMDRRAWAALIDRMRTTPSGIVAGAVISTSNEQVLLDWLVANFGPESTPMPREYIPRILGPEDHLSDTSARALLQTSCSNCHELESTFDARMDETEWRRRLMLEISRGAPVLMSQADPLIEWLSRSDRTGIND